MENMITEKAVRCPECGSAIENYASVDSGENMYVKCVNNVKKDEGCSFILFYTVVAKRGHILTLTEMRKLLLNNTIHIQLSLQHPKVSWITQKMGVSLKYWDYIERWGVTSKNHSSSNRVQTSLPRSSKLYLLSTCQSLIHGCLVMMCRC